MRFGISTACFYPGLTETAVSSLAGAGVQCIEIFLNTYSELEKEYLEMIMQRLNGVEVVSVHPFTSGLEPFLFFTGYDRRYEDGIEFYKQYFEACAQLGARYVVFHGDRKDSAFDSRLYFERFARLSCCAWEFGVSLLQENVARCRSGQPGFVRAMREYLHGEVGFVLDTKQCLRSGTTADQMLTAMDHCVKHVHISDSSPSLDCLPPGTGQFDFDSFFCRLGDLGYDGAVMIELYRQNYKGLPELLQSYSYLCTKK